MESGHEGVTRPSLLLRLRNAQDAQSWATFVEVYGPLVFGHCKRRGLQHSDAEDVTQRVFAQVSQAIRRFDYDPQVGRFRSWLGTIVRNEVNRFLRQRNRDPSGSEAVPEQLEEIEADTGWDDDFSTHLLQEAMKRSRPHFEPETWQAFEEVWSKDQPAAEVARRLGRPIDWVYGCKSRVLERLWQVIQELAEDAPGLAMLGRDRK